jgi:hypothetical protein
MDGDNAVFLRLALNGTSLDHRDGAIDHKSYTKEQNFASLQRGVEKVVKHQVVQLAEAATLPKLQDRSANHRAADLFACCWWLCSLPLTRFASLDILSAYCLLVSKQYWRLKLKSHNGVTYERPEVSESPCHVPLHVKKVRTDHSKSAPSPGVKKGVNVR